MKKLPIGLQTIQEILEEGHIYVDKTGFARDLIANEKHYFLSRPRRFGKSLFLNTLEEIFSRRIDSACETNKAICIFELKLDQDADTALTQAERKKYRQRFLSQDKPTLVIGVNFSSSSKNISDWKGCSRTAPQK